MRVLLVPLGIALLTLGQGPRRSASFPKGTVEARGVCDVRPESVACWDMDGKPATDIVEAIRSHLGTNGQEVQFRLGKKNRYLVLRRPQALQISYQTGTNNSLSANSTYNSDPVTDFVRLAADPSDATATLKAQATIQSNEDVSLPLREGTKMDIEGRNVEVGAATKVVPVKGRPMIDPYSNRTMLGDAWNVVIGLGGEPGYVSWAYTPLDASGAPIRYVDASGKPIAALKALALEPNLPAGNNGYSGNPLASTAKPKAAVAVFQGYGAAPAFRATTNIDPKWIATLRIRASHTESMDLGPFPLDPK